MNRGYPVGTPLPSTLSEIVLNEADQELEERGHRGCCWVDDFESLVRSGRVVKRVMEEIKSLQDP